jgi:penicillin amidase
MRAKLSITTIVLLVGLQLGAAGRCGWPTEIGLAGLEDPVQVVTDRDGVRHLTATNDFDLARAQGFVHCRDRFFQMDATRRQVSGDLAELLGIGEIGSDIQGRVIGLRRAAQRTFDAVPQRFKDVLQAYADGVNECLASQPLPPEYALLELTAARPWNPVDSLAIGKGLAASLSLDIDIGLTEDLSAYVAAGIAQGFDGQVMFSEDVFRTAPMDPASTIPDATGSVPFAKAKSWKADPQLLARSAELGRRVKGKLSEHPLAALAMNRRESFVGSNEWGVTGSKSTGGRAIIANDPHLSLNQPSTFYEWHLTVTDDPEEGPMNVSGVGIAGSPGVILGQNDRVTWGATTNPMDVSDTFLDEFHALLPECFLIGAIACIFSEGTFHPVELEFPTYLVNQVGDSILDNLVDVTGSLPTEAQLVATVPFRSFGPILGISDPSVILTGGITDALVLQYTGFHATGELLTFSVWNRAEDLDDFLEGLASFDAGSQNWAYADVDGNLAYFSSAENPLRKDLELGTVVGLPPYFIRDGSGDNNWVPDPAHSQGQAIPFAILPFEEMPHTINPENDFFVNANNDPAGTSLDNDPLNQVRPGNPGAIYYLNPGYAIGMRAGRITRLIENHPGQISANDMQRFQANVQQLDAELMTPFLLEAFDNASQPGAPSELADLANDPQIAEAAGRLAEWDFSAPTGIAEGYDAHDVMGMRTPEVTPEEQAASVAATIYNLWRGKAIRSVMDARLVDLGLGSNLPGSSEALKALHNLLSANPYTGVGASGVDFIPQPVLLSAEERRDLALLTALDDALVALASVEFAPAFGGSTDQDDYRWGKLHRIVLDHEFEDSFNIPPQSGFEDLSSELRGLARDGGYNVVNASGFSARAVNLNSFMFGGGPVRRYVGQAQSAPEMISGQNVIPGGPSGIPGNADYATQLGAWLTVDYHTVNMTQVIPRGTREELVPTAP